MQDRVPLYPGRVTLTPVAGQENTYDMVRADQPTQAGTPLNKASLLKDTTAAKLGLTDTAVPDEALQKLIPPIGEVKITRRTDLGDKWLLCNGDTFSKDSYPQLGQLLPASTTGKWDVVGTPGGTIKKIYCYNGRWIAVGSNASGYPAIYTAANLEGAWAENVLYSASETLTSVFCYNNRWVAVGYTSLGYPVIYTTTNPAGTWTRKQVSSSKISIYDVYCYNGTWVAVGGTSSGTSYFYPFIYFTSNPASSWTEKQLSTSTEGVLKSVYCYNGTWAVVGKKSGLCYTTANPSGTWSKNAIVAGYRNCIAVYYNNGTWVALLELNSNSSQGAIAFFYTDNPAGTWTEGASIPDTRYDTESVFCYNGTHVVCLSRLGDYSKIVYTMEDISSEASIDENVIIQGAGGDRNSSIFCYNGTWALTNSRDIYSPVNALPEISLNGVYAYIKAKE